jgi:uncharacterized protein (DUF1697 family)
MVARRYVALLRGINVGGRNTIPMADLRQAMEDAGHDEVRTYIQSGNVLFKSGAPRRSLEPAIEGLLEARFGVPIVVVLRSHEEMRRIVQRAPAGFGTAPGTYHSDVVFLKQPLTARQAMGVVQLREGVDQAWPGTGVVYFARLSAQRTKSRMSRIVATPEYQLMTIRSWATATKLVDVLGDDR